ncbi:MAG TPA: thioredoxin domain-containing protein [Terracidiphilus sp.]|nr:thioredoxin domain-containing protein [Terracidiphilus sp.]
MLRTFPFRSLGRRFGLLLGLATLLVALPAANAQFSGATPTTPVHDPAALKPPPGAKVAMIEFYDMECPMCAETNPLLMQAEAKYHIPWVRHDFPIPGHPWSFQAAVFARWFDTKSKDLGNAYRDSVFANQNSIETQRQLVDFTQKFAASKGQQVPFMVDPQGKLAAEVKADAELGQRIGVEHTPTIWIVTAGGKGPAYREVLDNNQLFQMIDQAIAQTGGSSNTRTAHR